MLVLTRKTGEAIHIRDDIVVTVLAVHEGHVRLGIQAPIEVPVHRQEVARLIESPQSREENCDAS
ncbi:MAG: carbon storage regulator CsrA [Planctomycetota bacterium]|nr:carbon storage regulator CsrA [Planctomycetota bacterium]